MTIKFLETVDSRVGMECRFCNLENEREKQRLFEVRPLCYVIFSNPRMMPGHLLVIPKRHTEHLAELDHKERKELFDTAIEYQERILQNLASGCDMRQHNRPFLPESELKVDHVHIHLQPREFKDELYQKSQRHHDEIFKPLSPKEVERIGKLLK